jgi:tetratricopeptide (TPR) repeat protein
VSAISLSSNEREDLSRAINLLTEATRKDPNFALAYCLIAKAHDLLYFGLLDYTPERRALGDAAVDKALRLRPDLPEAHFAAALHYYTCYRDFERARTHISIAAKFSPNDPELLQVTAIIDQAQGRWEHATTALEKAVNLDPRNPELLESLADQYSNLRRFRDADRLRDRLIELEPDQPLFVLNKADAAFCEKGDLKAVRALYEAIPPSMKDDVQIRNQRWYYAMCDRDYNAAREIVHNSPNEDIFISFVTVPRRCADIWLELIQGNHPKMEEFRATREQLSKQIGADPTNALLLSVVAQVDLALGLNEEAISEAKRAIEMLPISKDAMIGPLLVKNLAFVYAWAGEWDLAFEQLDILAKRPNSSFLNYGDLKFDPSWDPLRKDPRFEKLLAELAPRD